MELDQVACLSCLAFLLIVHRLRVSFVEQIGLGINCKIMIYIEEYWLESISDCQGCIDVGNPGGIAWFDG